MSNEVKTTVGELFHLALEYWKSIGKSCIYCILGKYIFRQTLDYVSNEPEIALA